MKPKARARVTPNAQARTFHEVGEVTTALLSALAAWHWELAKEERTIKDSDKQPRLRASDFASTIVALEAIKTAVDAAITDEIGLANRYVSWAELAEALSSSRSGVSSRFRRAPLHNMDESLRLLRKVAGVPLRSRYEWAASAYRQSKLSDALIQSLDKPST